MLELDTDSGELTWYGKPLARLSRSETLLLEHFIEHPEFLISQDNLLDAGWPQSVVAPNTLVVAIKNIRKNLSKTRLSIETVHRRGYIFHSGEDIVRTISAEKNVIPVNVSVDKSTHDDTALKVEASTDNTYENDERVTKKVNSEHPLSMRAVLLSRWHSFYMPVKLVFFYILLLASVISACFIYELTNEWHCYKIGSASVCGIFELDNMQEIIIGAELKGQPGEFLYGYENDFSKIKIYKIY